MFIQQQSQQSVTTARSRAAHQTLTTTMAAQMHTNRGSVSGVEDATSQLHLTTPNQQMWLPPIDVALGCPFRDHEVAISLDVFGDVPWDVGPSFAYFPTHCPWTRTWNVSSASTRDANSPPPLSPNSLEGTESLSSGDSVSSETSPPVSYAAYLAEQSDVDIWDLQELSPQGLDMEHGALPIPAGHFWDTAEEPPLSRVCSVTVVPESESGLQERGLSQSSAVPENPRRPSPRKSWACRECDKQFQDKTALKYAPHLITTSVTRLTRTANIYVTTPTPSNARHVPASFQSPRISEDIRIQPVTGGGRFRRWSARRKGVHSSTMRAGGIVTGGI